MKNKLKMNLKSKKDNEVYLWSLSILTTNKDNYLMCEKTKQLLEKYGGMFSPDWSGRSLGFFLFSTPQKRNGFYEETKDYLELAVMIQLAIADKKYLSKEVIEEAERAYKESEVKK